MACRRYIQWYISYLSSITIDWLWSLTLNWCSNSQQSQHHHQEATEVYRLDRTAYKNIANENGLYNTTSTIHILNLWSRVLLEKLAGFQLVKKFPAFYGTRRFITEFTIARHLSLTKARSIHSMPPHPTSWRSILILASQRLGFPSGLFPSCFPTKTLYTPLLSPNTCYMPCPSHSSRFDHPYKFGEQYRSLSSLCSFFHSPVTSFFFGRNTLLNTLFSNTLSLRSSLNLSAQFSHPHKTTGKITVLCILIFKFLDSKLKTMYRMIANNPWSRLLSSADIIPNKLRDSLKLLICAPIPLTPNVLYSGRAVSPLNSRTATIVAANSVSKLEEFCSLLFDYLVWFAMLQDPWRSGFYSADKLHPLHPLNPFTNDAI